MPELPEVETVVRTLRPQVLGCRIERVDVLRERSLHPLSLPVERLAGTRISAVRRRGKLALLDLEPPAAAAAVPVPSLLAVHLRMTRASSSICSGRTAAGHSFFSMTCAPLGWSLPPHRRCWSAGTSGVRWGRNRWIWGPESWGPACAAAGPSRPRCWIRPYWPVSATSTRTNPCSGPASIPGGLPESFRRRKRTVCAVPCRRCCGNPSPSAAAPSGTIVMPTAMWALSRIRSLSTVVADRPAVVAAARWKKAVSPAGPRYPVRGASTRGGALPAQGPAARTAASVERSFSRPRLLPEAPALHLEGRSGAARRPPGGRMPGSGSTTGPVHARGWQVMSMMDDGSFPAGGGPSFVSGLRQSAGEGRSTGEGPAGSVRSAAGPVWFRAAPAGRYPRPEGRSCGPSGARSRGHAHDGLFAAGVSAVLPAIA